ncbi:MAG: IclR family transcriptional regulator [Gulosibacter sp.]|uniref:IclR family transcriptional regulator n=1 Tax=Gulosibacter sp. TaxID=2817531 RepID=UPI003F93E9DF
MNNIADATETTRRRQPLARGIELLTVMVDGDQETYGVRELAGKLEVSPSTAHRLVTDLEQLGLVDRTPEGSYRLGLEFMRMAWATTSRYPVHEIAEPALNVLRDTTEETAFFGVYNEQRGAMMFATAVESLHPLRYIIPIRTWVPLYQGASGLSILSFVPEERIDAILNSSPDAAKDRQRLLSQIETIKQEGVAFSYGERIQGAHAVAAPVFGSKGIVGAIGVSFPESRAKEKDLNAIAREVKNAANELTAYFSKRTYRN